MFDGWSYSQVLRVIGQSLEERGVQDFSLVWQDGEFVVRGKRLAPVERGWIDKLLGHRAAQVERNVEIHYGLKSILWLQIRGEGMRTDPNRIPDYFRLSQTLRTVGSYIQNRAMPIVSLRRGGGTLYLEFQERSGKKRVEEHGMGSFENYFLRTYLRQRKERPS
ncbi:MAG TPA: hypothetical protein VFK65_03980 [Candidatus Binatia bacterium]|nr:hypothetical protein [Candidatus Binatia bacterium]